MESCIRQDPDRAISPPAIHSAADSNGPFPIVRIHRSGKEGHVFAQDILIVRFLQGRAKLTFLPVARHLKILATFDGPIGYLPNRQLEWTEEVCAEGNSDIEIGGQSYFRSADGFLMPTKKDQAPPDLRRFKP